jgi:hypothetical protein
LGAQTKPDSTAQAQRTLPTIRWVTRPTPIKLTTDQRKKLDSIGAKYTAEDQQIRKQANGQSGMGMTLKMLGLARKYQNMVRPILNPAQQTVFDKNIQASVMSP